MSDTVIETRGLRRSFGCHPALDGLNLGVPSGSIFGFLGRNGAGKTTTIRILMGLIRPDGGEARVPAPASNSAAALVSSPKTKTSTPT